MAGAIITAFLIFVLFFNPKQGTVVEHGAIANSSHQPWQLTNPSLHREIEGFLNEDSLVAGEATDFYVSCKNDSFSAAIFRVGWYKGTGAHEIATIPKTPCQYRTVPDPDPATGLVGPKWPTTLTLQTDTNWPSGLYLIKLTGHDGRQAYTSFIVRPKTPQYKLLFIHANTTEAAYNRWGGNSLYQGYTPDLKVRRAVNVSLNRPMKINFGAGYAVAWEYPMIRFAEHYGYGMDYATDVDIHEHPTLLRHYKAVIIAGHDEYWTKAMYDGYERAVKKGLNLAVFGANTAFRAARLARDPISGRSNRILVDYKQAELDPYYTTSLKDESTPWSWTSDPLDRPESRLLGLSWGGETANDGKYTSDLVVYNASSWIFDHTGLKNGDRLPGLVGVEYDKLVPQFAYPASLNIVFHSPIVNSKQVLDTADGSVYQSASGGMVFDGGTIAWSRGLDPTAGTYSPALVQITRNIFNRFDH